MGEKYLMPDGSFVEAETPQRSVTEKYTTSHGYGLGDPDTTYNRVLKVIAWLLVFIAAMLSYGCDEYVRLTNAVVATIEAMSPEGQLKRAAEAQQAATEARLEQQRQAQKAEEDRQAAIKAQAEQWRYRWTHHLP